MTGSRVSRRRALGRLVLAGLIPGVGVAVGGAGCAGTETPEGSGRTGDRDSGRDTSERVPDGPAESPEPEDFADTSPFTGQKVDQHGPVLAVKIDNVSAARPHRGVRSADLVYLEQVEAGLSRLMAVYSSELPDLIGPVRSARESDLEILRQFGRPGFAYSGANEVVLSLLADAPAVSLSPDQLGSAYVRSDDRSAPHNLYLDPKRLLDAKATADEISVARDIGFRFGPAPEGKPGEPVRKRTVSFPAFELTIRPDADRGGWRLAMDGEPYDANPATVVVQRVRLRDSEHERLRAYGSPFLVTTGEGEATVLRDGRAYSATWSRPTPADGTTFRGEDGNVIYFTRGQTWIIYDAS